MIYKGRKDTPTQRKRTTRQPHDYTKLMIKNN